MIEKIQILRPKACPVSLIRIGGNSDGAYLLPSDLQGIKACFSPGVSNRKNFEDELFDVYGIESHMCDFSSDLENFRTPLRQPGQTFRKKWLDIDGSVDSICLKQWIEELVPDPNDDLILQMDIEGAEYRNLINTPDFILHRFRIIVLELHSIKKSCQSLELFSKELGPLLEHLDKHFICVHAHPNNCHGEFNLTGTKLNLPNVLELTFLRRNRWVGFAERDCIPPMLPHPLDVPRNVATNPPVFLNEHWFESGKRPEESTIKMLSDQLEYLKSELTREKNTVSSLNKIAQYISNERIKLFPESDNESFYDLAMGKSFSLSSGMKVISGTGRVIAQSPFFFQTRKGRNQYITIDLEFASYVSELRITNRTNGFQERSRSLFYCLHGVSKPDFLASFPVTIEENYIRLLGQTSITKVKNKTPRYLTIFSQENTILHFSCIQIIGRVCATSE